MRGMGLHMTNMTPAHQYATKKRSSCSGNGQKWPKKRDKRLPSEWGLAHERQLP